MKFAHQLSQLARYIVKGKSRFYLHSPFIYELSEAVLNDKRNFYAFDEIAYLRAALKRDTGFIEVNDFGAGKNPVSKKQISKIASRTSIAPRYGKLLFRLIEYFKPNNMLELGTSLGISTAYQAMANGSIPMKSIEGCINIAGLAQQNIDRLGIENVEIINGQFDYCLPKVLAEFEQLDYVFFDGNHQKEPTLKYFEICLQKAHDKSIFIFDDIHWSAQMTEAWNEIKANPRCTVSIDLHQIGIIFFRKEQRKEDFTLWYW